MMITMEDVDDDKIDNNMTDNIKNSVNNQALIHRGLNVITGFY